METEYELTLRDYIDIFRRHVLKIALVFIVVVSGAFILSIVLPPVYKSSGTILIESQQISSEFIASSITGYAGERIEVIKQRVMTRDNLLRIIRKYGLFGIQDNSRVPSELIDELRNKISINLLSSDLSGRRRGKTTIAFSIAAEDRHPELAYKVTNEIVTLFLDENIKSRVEMATETTEFLSQEAKRLKSELEKMEGLVAKYKQENADALPEHLNIKVNILERTQKSLADLDREYKLTESDLKRLDIELASAKSGADIGESPLSELEKLKAEYKKATLLYKENHPTVRLLKHKLDSLNKVAESNDKLPNPTDSAINNILVSKVQSMIDTAQDKLQTIEEQRKPLRKKIQELEGQIIKTPQVELALTSLMRDYGNAKKKYEELQSKQLSAQIAENLEGENKSERFILIDPPLFPDKPIKPNRFKIILLGIVAGLLAGGGIVFLLETLNQKIRGSGALKNVLGRNPLVEIPYIVTSEEIINRRLLYKRILMGAFGLLIISLIVVNFAYMQLDLLFFKIMSRF